LVTEAQMKEQKFHHTNLFAVTNIPNLPLLDTSNDITQPFNPQILTAMFGASNAGLDSQDISGVTPKPGLSLSLPLASLSLAGCSLVLTISAQSLSRCQPLRLGLLSHPPHQYYHQKLALTPLLPHSLV
jgi:hypothetical protein